LSTLPEPSSGDIFLDFEGDPFVGERGLEYLLGYVTLGENGELAYTSLWSLSREAEKSNFEQFRRLGHGSLAAPSGHIHLPFRSLRARRHVTAHGAIRIPGRGSRPDASGRLVRRLVRAMPRQDSTGGKQKLGPISKQGDRYLRRILVVGATQAVWKRFSPPKTARNQGDPRRHDRLSIFFLYRVWSPGRNLGPR
jgi:transposase IS116/IS110/IS902 family protein